MSAKIEKRPIYDDRVNEVLRALVEGKSRDELARELGHKNYKTLDIYMRRKNFTWDRDKQNYVPAHSRLEKQDLDIALVRSSKIATVLSLFQKESADAKTIAKRLGFADHRELAVYMKGKGYRWSSDAGNYVKVVGEIKDEESSIQTSNEAVEGSQGAESGGRLETQLPPMKAYRMDAAQMERFLPLLELLERNRDRVIDLIVPGAESGKVPRYAVPGIFVTKSVHMTNTLDQMVREYSKEKNISQRDIFAVALIEFFQRYGYEREIETLLGRG